MTTLRQRTTHLALTACLFVATAAAAGLTSPDPTGSAPTGAALTGPEGRDTVRVKPGCCTSNCVRDRDCDPICGKGNCVCLTTSDCCRRCTF